MKTNTKEPWILTGYDLFAKEGPKGIKIEVIAKRVSISKSSFYHHFAHLDLFLELLIEYHLQQSHIIADKENSAKNIDPELIDILVKHKTDLLFNRQLRINREHKLYLDALVKSNKTVGDAFVMLWVKDFDLKLSRKQLQGIFELALDNFYLRINAENLNHQWLSEYFANLKRIAKNFV
ncbi:MAG: TetR/AcrR family transcriptional regulator [Ignavibacteriales bacterium]|nr:TetR/AcrR family transcriptional regulator [Ignavibacteriales bacterium]